MAVNVSAFLRTKKINNPSNDYVYVSGWNRKTVWARQYKLEGVEAQRLVDAIKTRFPSIGDQRKAVKNLLKRSEVDFAGRSTMAKGGISLTAAGATVLNALAAATGIQEQFQSGQLPPLHPVG